MSENDQVLCDRCNGYGIDRSKGKPRKCAKCKGKGLMTPPAPDAQADDS